MTAAADPENGTVHGDSFSVHGTGGVFGASFRRVLHDVVKTCCTARRSPTPPEPTPTSARLRLWAPSGSRFHAQDGRGRAN